MCAVPPGADAVRTPPLSVWDPWFTKALAGGSAELGRWLLSPGQSDAHVGAPTVTSPVHKRLGKTFLKSFIHFSAQYLCILCASNVFLAKKKTTQSCRFCAPRGKTSSPSLPSCTPVDKWSFLSEKPAGFICQFMDMGSHELQRRFQNLWGVLSQPSSSRGGSDDRLM